MVSPSVPPQDCHVATTPIRLRRDLHPVWERWKVPQGRKKVIGSHGGGEQLRGPPEKCFYRLYRFPPSFGEYLGSDELQPS